MSPCRHASRRVIGIGGWVLILGAGVALAQEPQELDEAPPVPPEATLGLGTTVAPAGSIASPVVTLDQDAFFAGSAFGKRVQEELERDRAALARENRRIETELVEEELALTQLRETTPLDEFSRMADAFDRKVQQTRETQDSKSIQLQQRLDAERQTFLNEAGPVLAELLRRRGAYAVIDRNAILLAFEGIDITREAISAIDAAIGSGSSAKLSPPTPLQRPGEDDTGSDIAPR